jgi:hypothetical protein
MVEARLLNRHGIGSDISSLAIFLTRVKTTPLAEGQLLRFKHWFETASAGMNLRYPEDPSMWEHHVGYEQNLPWQLRKLFCQYLASIVSLPSKRLQRFARCVLLRAGQLAVDCRKETMRADEFRQRLRDVASGHIAAIRQYRNDLNAKRIEDGFRTLNRTFHSPASALSLGVLAQSEIPKPRLVVTSPPYPGVHVLYHRWNIRGRRESPALFWVAGCQDGHGSTHYTLGDRRQNGLKAYFTGIEESYRRLRTQIASDALVVQMVAFNEPDWQLPAFLDAMERAGFAEEQAQKLGIKATDRLWRPVPGRRWFAVMREELATSKEVVLFHRPKRKGASGSVNSE